MPGALRILVNGTRVLAALDQPAHDTVADLDGHVVDSRVLRQRERVHSLDVLSRRIAENLGDGDASQKPADAGAHLRMLQRAGALNRAVLADDAERPRRLSGCWRGKNRWLQTNCGEEQQGERRRENEKPGAPDMAFHGNLREM